MLSGAREHLSRSAWGTSKWLGPRTPHIQGSCRLWTRWNVFIGSWRKDTDYRPALWNHMWFIKRARQWYRTMNREERVHFREAGWQRMNNPIGCRGMQKNFQSYLCHLLAVWPVPKSLQSAVSSFNYDNISVTELLHIVNNSTSTLHLECHRFQWNVSHPSLLYVLFKEESV